MCTHDILEVHASVEKLVGLDVAIVVGLSRLGMVILFRKEARGSQHEAREPMLPMEELAQVFRRRLGDAIDVSGHGLDLLCHPHRRAFRRRLKRATESAGRAGQDEGAHTSQRGLLQERERARDVGIHKALPAVRHDMGFMQGRRVQNGVDTCHALLDKVPVTDGADLVCEVRLNDIETDSLMVHVPQSPNQRFTQMPTAPCHQDLHAQLSLPCGQSEGWLFSYHTPLTLWCQDLFRRHHTPLCPCSDKGALSERVVYSRHGLIVGGSFNRRYGGTNRFAQCFCAPPQPHGPGRLSLYGDHTRQTCEAGGDQLLIAYVSRERETLVIEDLSTRMVPLSALHFP